MTFYPFSYDAFQQIEPLSLLLFDVFPIFNQTFLLIGMLV